MTVHGHPWSFIGQILDTLADRHLTYLYNTLILLASPRGFEPLLPP